MNRHISEEEIYECYQSHPNDVITFGEKVANRVEQRITKENRTNKALFLLIASAFGALGAALFNLVSLF
ncbi:hypothetical protein [Limnobacter sp. P1]|uniref:hypothetical protein n=1 Tax=Limnobacter olei TaxID=3031298 RepID=UPI0023AE9F28|nr:hypothetical protein [Limnobacter sp. P1]